MKISPIFAWYDFWIGFFWDRKARTLYFFPIPMVGLKIQIWGKRCYVLRKRGYYRPKAQGYASFIQEAGRFTLEEATRREYPHDEPVTKHHIREFLT